MGRQLCRVWWGGVEGGSWAPFSAFPAEMGAVGQLTLAELEPGVGRDSEERKARVVGKLARSGMDLGSPSPGVASWPSREGTGRLNF